MACAFSFHGCNQTELWPLEWFRGILFYSGFSACFFSACLKQRNCRCGEWTFTLVLVSGMYYNNLKTKIQWVEWNNFWFRLWGSDWSCCHPGLYFCCKAPTNHAVNNLRSLCLLTELFRSNGYKQNPSEEKGGRKVAGKQLTKKNNLILLRQLAIA